MAVKIRLRRTGSNKNPFFKIVATDERCATSGRFLEDLGWYDPKRKSSHDFEARLDRIRYWQDCGAQLSDTVRSLLRRLKPTYSVPAEPTAAAAAEPAAASDVPKNA